MKVGRGARSAAALPAAELELLVASARRGRVASLRRRWCLGSLRLRGNRLHGDLVRRRWGGGPLRNYDLRRLREVGSGTT